MVAGIPNVGKSTFINTFAGKACAKTGNKPGVTKGKQWIRLNKSVELLDTPGILWPKFEDQEVGMRLAYIGSIKDDILNIEELALDVYKRQLIFMFIFLHALCTYTLILQSLKLFVILLDQFLYTASLIIFIMTKKGVIFALLR